MVVKEEERKKNSRLTEFEEVREAVIQNALPKSEPLRKRKSGQDSTLFRF